MQPASQVTPRPDSHERLAHLIRIPTVSAEIEQRGMEPFEEFVSALEELYPLTHEHLSRERVTDLGVLYHWQGADAEADPVVLMAHFDVVPVDEDESWTYPPFAGTIADGYVHGRGALDDKGPLLVILEAVENLLAAGFTPARDVFLSFGGNEETFGDAAKVIASTLQSRGIKPWMVIDEGGAIIDSPLSFVPMTAAMVGVGEKGLLTLRLTARGEGGHASAPPKLTAVSRVARAVNRLNASTFWPKAPVSLSRMLRIAAGQTKGAPRALLRGLAAASPVTALIFSKLGGEGAALVRTTVAHTKLDGGTADNVLPSRASATVNLRLALGTTVAQTVARARRRIRDPLVEVAVVESDEPSPESSTENEQFRLISRAVQASHPEAVTVPYVMLAATDSRHFHRFCPATYRFAPLAMSKELRDSVHGVNECVQISELARGEVFYRTLLTKLPDGGRTLGAGGRS